MLSSWSIWFAVQVEAICLLVCLPLLLYRPRRITIIDLEADD